MNVTNVKVFVSNGSVRKGSDVDSYRTPLDFASCSSGISEEYPLLLKNGDDGISQGGIYIKKPDPRQRVMARRTSHTLLYVPEQRRISNVSGNSVASCPPGTVQTSGEEDDKVPPAPSFSLHLSPVGTRRKSVQTGAPAIGFRPLKTFERRASQPTLQFEAKKATMNSGTSSGGTAGGTVNLINTAQSTTISLPPDKAKMLTKRVSWLSMKSLQQEDPKTRRSSACGSPRGGSPSRTLSQYGSQPFLAEDRDFDSDTPPLDTLSWSNAGSMCVFVLVNMFL